MQLQIFLNTGRDELLLTDRVNRKTNSLGYYRDIAWASPPARWDGETTASYTILGQGSYSQRDMAPLLGQPRATLPIPVALENSVRSETIYFSGLLTKEKGHCLLRFS